MGYDGSKCSVTTEGSAMLGRDLDINSKVHREHYLSTKTFTASAQMARYSLISGSLSAANRLWACSSRFSASLTSGNIHGCTRHAC